jgi:hypothetical protein
MLSSGLVTRPPNGVEDVPRHVTRTAWRAARAELVGSDGKDVATREPV